MNKRLLALMLSLVMIFSATIAFAAETGNVYNLDGSLFATGNEMNISNLRRQEVNVFKSQFLYGFEGNYYSMEDVQAAYSEAEQDMEVFRSLLVKKDPIVPEEPSGDLEVVEVSAINPTTIKLMFNQEVEELDRTDVVVTNIKTSDRQYVKEVKLAEDKKSAEVTFYDALVTKNTYKVVVGESEKEFDYVVGEVAKIEVETTQVVKSGTATAIKYKAFDANGLDITNTASVKFESTLNITDGKVTLAKDTQGFVYVVAVDKDGKEILRSDRITVKAEDAKAVKLLAYTTEATPDFTAEDFEAKHSVRKGDTATLSLFVEDQFGAKSSATSVKFESLNKEVALVDQATGLITPLNVGTVDIRITVGDINQIIQVTVEEDSKVANIELDKAELNLSDKLNGESVKLTVKDQYGKTFTGATLNTTVLTSEVKEGKEIVQVMPSNIESWTAGVAQFKIVPVEGKEGKAVVEFSYKDGDDTFTTTLTVNVAKADVVDNYVVEGFEKELDKYADEDKNTNAMTLKVFGVDANGVKTGEVTENLTIEVLDKDGKPVEGALDASTNENLKKDETYKVVVKVGTLTIFEDTFTVVDTKPEEAKPVVEQIKSSIKVERDSTLLDALKDAFKVTKDGNNVVITSFTYFSDNTLVIDNDGIKDVGTATLVITKVNDIEVSNLMVNVEVGVLSAPEGDTEFTIEGQGIDIKYLAFGLMNEAGTAQKVATLDEVKEFIDSEYGVNFKASNIVLEEGKLSIIGELLSTADWNKVKEDGNKTVPYKITVLNSDKTNKLVKIAMYEDGVAIFEEIK